MGVAIPGLNQNIASKYCKVQLYMAAVGTIAGIDNPMRCEYKYLV